MPLPLQIFEQRYRVMTRELLASGGEFGVLLIREGHEAGGEAFPFDVGTSAVIEEWRELPDGRFAITARGARRFRLVRMLAPRPYPYGEVEMVEEVPTEPTPQLRLALQTVRSTFPAYFRLALSLSDQWAQGMKLPESPHELVNFLGGWLDVEEEARQRLLEIVPAPERVAHLAEMLDELLSRTRDEVSEYRRKKFGGLGAGN